MSHGSSSLTPTSGRNQHDDFCEVGSMQHRAFCVLTAACSPLAIHLPEIYVPDIRRFIDLYQFSA